MPSTGTDRIDGLTTSVAVKAPCRTVSSSNITLAGIQTIGGVTVQAGNPALNILPDRVLVNGQTDQTQNGIYVVNAQNWTRSLDFDGARDAVQGTIVPIYTALNGIIFWQLSTANPIDFGTSLISFQSLATGVQIPAGGAFGQTLQKASSASYDLTWGNPSFPVSTVFTRTGNIVATSGDYSIGQISGASSVAATGSYTDLLNTPTIYPAVNLAAAGSTPNANAASIVSSTQALTLQPASSVFPGILNTRAQTIAGAKTFSNTITGSITGAAGTAAALSSAHNIYGNPFDGTSDLAQVIASSFGGTNSSAVAFTGPSSTPKTFALPTSSDTIACLGQQQAFKKQQTLTPLSLLSSTNLIAWDASSGNNARHNATENTTLQNPSNLVDGTVYSFQWCQSSTTARTLAYGNKWKFSGSNTVSSVTGTTHVIAGVYDSTNINCTMAGPFS